MEQFGISLDPANALNWLSNIMKETHKSSKEKGKRACTIDIELAKRRKCSWTLATDDIQKIGKTNDFWDTTPS